MGIPPARPHTFGFQLEPWKPILQFNPAGLHGGTFGSELHCYLPAVVFVPYFVDRNHSWHIAFLETFGINQGNLTPQTKRHDWRTITLDRSRHAFALGP